MIELDGADFNKKTKRKDAAPDRQLSQLQRHILLWLMREYTSYYLWKSKFLGEDPRKEEALGLNFSQFRRIESKGVRWSTKKVLDVSPSRAQTTSLSKALRRLEDRALVVTYDSSGGTGKKQITSHVKLTNTGFKAARELTEQHGMSKRELRALPVNEVRRRSALWVINDALLSFSNYKAFVNRAFSEQGFLFVELPLPDCEWKRPFPRWKTKETFIELVEIFRTTLYDRADRLQNVKEAEVDVDKIVHGLIGLRFGSRVLATDAEVVQVLQDYPSGPLPPLPFPVGLAIMPNSITANMLQVGRD